VVRGCGEIEHVVPTTSLGEGTLVRLCNLNRVNVERHDPNRAKRELPGDCRLSEPRVSVRESGRRGAERNIQEAQAVGIKIDQTRITRAIGVALGMETDARFEDMYLRCNAPDTRQRPCTES
jgi:hypothetical protein